MMIPFPDDITANIMMCILLKIFDLLFVMW
jgi:hypothetical protein